jgi:hypothetical protein
VPFEPDPRFTVLHKLFPHTIPSFLAPFLLTASYQIIGQSAENVILVYMFKTTLTSIVQKAAPNLTSRTSRCCHLSSHVHDYFSMSKKKKNQKVLIDLHPADHSFQLFRCKGKYEKTNGGLTHHSKNSGNAWAGLQEVQPRYLEHAESLFIRHFLGKLLNAFVT